MNRSPQHHLDPAGPTRCRTMYEMWDNIRLSFPNISVLSLAYANFVIYTSNFMRGVHRTGFSSPPSELTTLAIGERDVTSRLQILIADWYATPVQRAMCKAVTELATHIQANNDDVEAGQHGAHQHAADLRDAA